MLIVNRVKRQESTEKKTRKVDRERQEKTKECIFLTICRECRRFPSIIVPKILYNPSFESDFPSGRWSLYEPLPYNCILVYFRADWRTAMEFPVGVVPAGSGNALSTSLLHIQVTIAGCGYWVVPAGAGQALVKSLEPSSSIYG